MKFFFLFAGLALLTLRILLYHQSRTRLRRARAVRAKVVSSHYTDFGGWWVEANYTMRNHTHTGHLLAGKRKYEPGESLECLLLHNGRLIHKDDADKLTSGQGLLLPAMFLLVAAAFLFFIPDIDLWKFFLLSALTLSCMVITWWGFLRGLIEIVRGEKIPVVITDVKIIKGRKYFFTYEFGDRTGHRVTASGKPTLIRQVSLEYLKCKIGARTKVRVDRKTGAVYESSAVGMVLSLMAAAMCFIAVILLI